MDLFGAKLRMAGRSEAELCLELPLFGAEQGHMRFRERLTSLFVELRSPICRYVLSLGVSPAEAEELTQEAFIRLGEQLRRQGEFEGIRNWLFRVAHNLAIDYQRSHRQAVDALDLLQSDGLQAAFGSNPEQTLLRRERLERLHVAVRKLPDLQQRCLHLRAEGFRYREIAGILGVSTSTVAESLRRAVAKLIREPHD